MPDTLNRYAPDFNGHMLRTEDGRWISYADHRAHIDALTAAVEALEPAYDPEAKDTATPNSWYFDGFLEAQDAVLAILRGEQQPKQTWAQRGRRLAAEEPHDA